MPKKLHQWFLWVPHKFHWFFVILTGAVIPFLTRNNADPKQHGEWYPFSNFPMYSTFEDTAYYVYVTDLEDKPLPFIPTFGRTASEVKKLYDLLLKAEIRRLKSEAIKQGGKYRPRIYQMTGSECRPAGDAALRQLSETAKPQAGAVPPAGLRLHQVDITLEDGKIVERAKLVGEAQP